MSALAVSKCGIKRPRSTRDQDDNDTNQTAKRGCRNPLDVHGVPDDHREQMEAALSNLTTAQIKNILIQASWQDVVVEILALAASQSVKVQRRTGIPAKPDFAWVSNAVWDELKICSTNRKIKDDEERKSYRHIAEGIKQIVQESVVQKVDPSDPYETKILAIECLIDVARMLSPGATYGYLSEVFLKREIPDCIVDGIFQIRTTLTAREMDKTISKSSLFKRASEVRLNMGADRWESMEDVCELFSPSSEVLQFYGSSRRVRDALCFSEPSSSSFQKRSESRESYKTAGQVRRDVETSIQRGIVAKLTPKSLFETRLNALKTLTLIGTLLARARAADDEGYHRGVLDDQHLDNLVTNSMQFVLSLSPEEKKKEDFNRYCPDEDILGLGDGGLVKGLLRLMSIKSDDDLPGLVSILRQLGIPTVPSES